MSFSAFTLLAPVAFISTVNVVRTDILRFRTLLSVLVATVGAHVLVGLTQFVNQGPFGLIRLGEGGSNRRVAIELPVVGDATLGPFVSGFTGMSFILAHLVVLVFCVSLVVASRRGHGRYLTAVGLLAMVVAVWMSASDAARGALLVAVVVFAVAASWVHRRRLAATARRVFARPQTALASADSFAVAALGLVILFFPSTVSGSNVRPSPGGVGGSGSDSSGGSIAGGAGGGGTSPAIEGLDLQELSIPLFIISNLGVRLQQYAVALDIFLRYPVFGLGGMNYVLVAGEYGIATPGGRSFPPAIHSLYITLLAETGIAGTVLYLGAVVAVLWIGWRFVNREGGDATLVLAALAGLVGVLAYSAFEILHLYSAAGLLPFWVVAGAVVGEARRHPAPDETVSTTTE